jgi:hypothetical protein
VFPDLEANFFREKGEDGENFRLLRHDCTI